ncbi:phage tail tape measure protein [Flavobacterium branchiophilum]|uniref:Phage tail tape measure protein n=1 Tax=Flavobacterium branchiophilum TaxID=55197 RepID=A0A2H3KE69_9FLAO|nr:phage tail tape measure protein [Flavobacterium branchiophilum]PDS26475.1 phage tail tape measure protein [Flavobacterium branchiophilum]
MDGVNFNLNFTTNGGAIFATLNTGLDNVQNNVTQTTKVFGDCYKALLAVDLASQGITQLSQMLDGVIAPGIALNTQMADLSAITGLTGAGLKEIEKAARDSAKTFGTDASQNVNSYKLILSQLSPEIAKNSEAMKLMGNNVNILSKTMGGDTVAATEVLTTAMNQYGVNLDNPIQASKIMADMMNVMAAGAKEGSAELPQIKQALEQVGMVAKTTGVSFVATNAAIQMLDKAGKKGAEGGVALRNVLTTLSEGRFASKDATFGLQQMGISTAKLADASIPLTDRLRMLKPVMQDTALMTKVFGKENMAASIALIQSADEQDTLAKKITGTNTAVEQANTVMGSYQERMNRATAIMNGWKISIFNATQAYVPYLKHFMTGITTLGESARGYMAVKSTIEAFLPRLFARTVATEADTLATVENTAVTGGSTIINRIYAATLGSITRATLSATMAQVGLNLAMLASPVGLVVIGIMALVGTFVYLWNTSKRFREILFGIWEAAQAVFNNIGVFIKRVWDMVVKPIIMAYYTFYKFVFTKIWEFIKWVFNGIAAVFVWLYERAVAVFTKVKDFVVGVFNWIVAQVSMALSVVGSFFSGLWEWFSGVFSGFAKFIDEWLIQPIKNAFGGVWDWVVGIFEKIMNKLTGIFAPIKKFFKTLFSNEGMTDVKAAYKDGEKKGAVSYDKDHKKMQKVEVVSKPEPKKDKNAFDITKGFQNGAIPPTKPISGVGAKDKKEGGSGGSSGSRSITIGKLIENMTLHFHGTVKESKESIKQSITEVLLTSVNDVNLAN